MSKAYELISYEDNKFIIKEEGVNFLNSIEEDIILITLISSTNDEIISDRSQMSLLLNLTNLEIKEELDNNKVILYSIPLEKVNTKILILNINTSNKHLLSLLFFTSSLFIFFIENNIDENELNKFLLINDLPNTIKINKKTNKEQILNACSPKLYFYITNLNSDLTIEDLDKQLYIKEKDKKTNLLKDNILNFFKEREYILDNNKDNEILIDKIIKEIKPKSIEEKKLDGKSLSFFIKSFCEICNNGGNPDYDNFCDNLVNNDLQIYKNKALNYYNSEMEKMNQIENEEILIPKIYQIKIKSIEIFNQVYYLNSEIFKNYEYKHLYNKTKSILENKFTDIENQKLLENLQKSEEICNELLKKHYEKINEKIINGKYNEKNTDEFMEDYKLFINGYKNEAKGNNKLKCLINFLEINKPKYFKCLLGGTIDYESNPQEGILSSRIEEDLKKMEDIRNKLDGKKREIKNLNAEIDRVEEEIKKAHTLEDAPRVSKFRK